MKNDTILRYAAVRWLVYAAAFPLMLIPSALLDLLRKQEWTFKGRWDAYVETIKETEASWTS
jgi:hypothetical protein